MISLAISWVYLPARFARGCRRDATALKAYVVVGLPADARPTLVETPQPRAQAASGHAPAVVNAPMKMADATCLLAWLIADLEEMSFINMPKS